MKPGLYLILAAFLLISCGRRGNEGAFDGASLGFRPEFDPEKVGLYPDTMKSKLRAMLDANLPWDSIIEETSKLIAKDARLLALDSLKDAKVLLYVKPPYQNFYARVNGFKVQQRETVLSLFPDTLCLAIGGYGMQGKFEGSLLVNGIRKAFKIEPYRNNRDTTIMIPLMDFRARLPNKPQYIDSLNHVGSDSIIVRVY